MCQTGIPDESVNSGLGRVENPQYTIASVDPQTRTFSMSVQYTHGNGDRMSIVEFVYNATTEEPYLVFDKENPSKTYVSPLVCTVACTCKQSLLTLYFHVFSKLLHVDPVVGFSYL